MHAATRCSQPALANPLTPAAPAAFTPCPLPFFPVHHPQIYDYRNGTFARYALNKALQELEAAGQLLVLSGPVKPNTREGFGGPGALHCSTARAGGGPPAAAQRHASTAAGAARRQLPTGLRLKRSLTCCAPLPHVLLPPYADTWKFENKQLQVATVEQAAANGWFAEPAQGGPVQVVHSSKGDLSSDQVKRLVEKGLAMAQVGPGLVGAGSWDLACARRAAGAGALAAGRADPQPQQAGRYHGSHSLLPSCCWRRRRGTPRSCRTRWPCWGRRWALGRAARWQATKLELPAVD